MALRELTKIGDSSCGLTLPIEWLKKNNLSCGDKLNLTTIDDSLLISTNNDDKEEIAEIPMNNKSFKLVNKFLISYYLKNYKKIKITGENMVENVEAIRVLKEKLSSLEIVEIKNEYILLKDLTSPEELNVADITKEIISMINVIFETIVKEDKRANFTLISNVDKNINKLAFLGTKCINYSVKSLTSTGRFLDFSYYRRVLLNLEEMGDILKRIARDLKNEHEEDTFYIPQLIFKVQDYFNFITEMLIDRNMSSDRLESYQDKKYALLREIEELGQNPNISGHFYLVIAQLLRDFIGGIEKLVLAVIDLKT